VAERRKQTMTNEPKNLNPRLTQRLLAYATVAGAAAAPTAARADVVYTPVHSRVNQDFPIDLNHDGINDFHVTSYDLSGAGELAVYPLVQGNRIIYTPEVCHDEPGGAAALHEGGIIVADRNFSAQANCMAYGFRSSITVYNGAWAYAKNRYLGFAFVIAGKEHFGWARLSIGQFYFQELGMITGYAYETIPGKPIIAGDEGPVAASAEQTTLGALALGAPGRKLWRKVETNTTSTSNSVEDKP
jgi:hypothetical protein